MRIKKRKEGWKIPFSYLDAFLLLLAGLVLSFGIYLATEQLKVPKEQGCEMTVLVRYEQALQEWIPKEGASLLDEKGIVIGEIMAVRTLTDGVTKTVELDCDMKDSLWQAGDSFFVETKECIKEGVVQSVRLDLEEEGVTENETK